MDNTNRLKKANEKEWLVDITDICQKIFGNDILVKAEILCFYDYSQEEAESAVESLINKMNLEMKDRHQLDFSHNSLFLTFINGKKIELRNSEWAWIVMKE